MLYGLVIVVHVVVCLILIAVILLQAGRGGGLSETFGADSHSTIFGTKMSVFLTRATVAAAALFLVTSLLLGIMTSRRGKSLIELQRRMIPTTVPAERGTIPGPKTEPLPEKIDKEELPLAKPEELPKN